MGLTYIKWPGRDDGFRILDTLGPRNRVTRAKRPSPFSSARKEERRGASSVPSAQLPVYGSDDTNRGQCPFPELAEFIRWPEDLLLAGFQEDDGILVRGFVYCLWVAGSFWCSEAGLGIYNRVLGH